MVRATGVAPTPGQNADAVWDETSPGHTISQSFGKLVATTFGDTAAMKLDYARRDAYTYGPTNLAAGATFVPAAGTVVTIAALDGVDVSDFRIMHGTIEVMRSDSGVHDNPWQTGYVGMLYCDGTNVGIKNGDAAGRDLVIEGITI